MTDIREIARRFNLRPVAGSFVGTCPACGYKDALRVTSQNGRALWWCGACQDQAAVTAAIAGQAAQAAPMTAAADGSQVQKREWALNLWHDAQPAVATVVERYLAARGITLRDDMPLRFLPNHLCRDSGKRWPVMLALMVDHDGTPRPSTAHSLPLTARARRRSPHPAKRWAWLLARRCGWRRLPIGWLLARESKRASAQG
jgi:hypothetical protein